MELCGSKQDYVGISRLLRDGIFFRMYALLVGLICDLYTYGSILDSYGINMVLYVIYMGFIWDLYWIHMGCVLESYWFIIWIDRPSSYMGFRGPLVTYRPLPKKNDLFNTVFLVLAVVK
jgi:hypothetical protein